MGHGTTWRTCGHGPMDWTGHGVACRDTLTRVHLDARDHPCITAAHKFTYWRRAILEWPTFWGSPVVMSSHAKVRLHALLEKLQPLLGHASRDDCDEMFRLVAEFSENPLARKRHRGDLRPIDSTMLFSLVSAVTVFSSPCSNGFNERDPAGGPSALAHPTVVARPGPHWLETGETVLRQLEPCDACGKLYSRVLACDGCQAAFRWCCAGYAREPLEDPCFNGREVLLQAYCALCLAAKSLSPNQVLAQETEFAALSLLFSSAKSHLRWIPGFSDGFCMFSAVWMSLEAAAFESSPFFCGAGMEGDNMDWRSSVAFLRFMVGAAHEAQGLGLSADELSVWQALEREPTLCARFRGQYRDESAFQAIALFLSRTVSTRVVVWHQDPATLLLYSRGYEGSAVLEDHQSSTASTINTRTVEINVLVWNGCCRFPHYDLLLPAAAARGSVQFDLITAQPKN